MLAFEQAKMDSIQHLTFIGIGLIRSIPLLGGAARCLYTRRQSGLRDFKGLWDKYVH